MKDFNQLAQGVTPEQTRAAVQLAAQQRQKTMLEQQQPVPVLKPHGMGEDVVDRQAYCNKLKQDHEQAQRLNQRAQEIYQMNITTLNDHISEPERASKATNDFNIQAKQAHERPAKTQTRTFATQQTF
jgi:hypothetical protein